MTDGYTTRAKAPGAEAWGFITGSSITSRSAFEDDGRSVAGVERAIHAQRGLSTGGGPALASAPKGDASPARPSGRRRRNTPESA
nr:hypothetical protein GCM10025699_67770 [Microbacterium flavescens]